LIALRFPMSEAAAAGLIELGLAISEGAALGFALSGWAPASWPRLKLRKVEKARKALPSLSIRTFEAELICDRPHRVVRRAWVTIIPP
jgi:hypothetical protein